MKRLLALATLLATLPILAALTASRPALPGPGAVISTHVRLFAALDRGDVDAASAFFTRTGMGMELRDGEYRQSPGAQFFLPSAVEDPARALAARFAGGRTRVVGGWSDCPDGELSWAALEIEHTPKDGARQRLRCTSLVSHVEGGWRLWYMHLSPAGEGAEALADR